MHSIPLLHTIFRLMHCCTSFSFDLAFLSCLGHLHIPLFLCSIHPAYPLLRLSPVIFHDFHGQLCALIVIHPIYVMHLQFRRQPFSSSNFFRHLYVPIFSLSIHLICHPLHTPSVVFLQHLHTPHLFAFHTMHFMCLMPHLLSFIFPSPLRHSSVPIFSHSMHFMCLPAICTTIHNSFSWHASPSFLLACFSVILSVIF